MFEFEGIGTHWWIEIFDNKNHDELEFIYSLIKECVAEFNKKYSRFLDNSELCKLNKLRLIENPSKELFEMLRIGEELREVTQNHFNLSVGSVLENEGYDKNYSFYSKKVTKSLTKMIPFKLLNQNRIELNKEISIDLGGIGKGFLINKVKELLIQNKVNYFFINAGGDIYASSENGKTLKFSLESPFENSFIGEIELKDSAIASSSNKYRRWRDKKSGELKSHLVLSESNSIVGKQVAAVFTLCKSALFADLANTALFVSQSKSYIEISNYCKADYLIVYDDKSYIKSDGYTGKLFIN